MHHLARLSPVLARRLAIGGVGVAILSHRYLFNGFFGGFFSRKAIYPPENISTQNRLYPTYISTSSELHDILLFREPLILNFTYMSDPRCNKLTQAVYDVLANKDQYPLDKPVALASIQSDTEGGRELMLTYGVNKVPSLVALHKQMPQGRYLWKGDEVNKAELSAWIKTVAETK